MMNNAQEEREPERKWGVQDNTSLSHLTLTSSKNSAQSLKKSKNNMIMNYLQPYDMTFNEGKELENTYTTV